MDGFIAGISMIVVVVGSFMLGRLYEKEPVQKASKSKFQKCTCKDPNYCDTWCNAKELFNKDFNDEKYSITEVCPHDIAVLKIIETTCTCETTVLVCLQCGKELEEPKKEC